jgi:3-oxoacyl-[acyl-carrier-protein] synthase-1
LSNEQLKDILSVPASKNISRTSLLSGMAAREALSSLTEELKKGLPFISGTTIGGMDVSEKFYDAYLKQPDKADFNLLLTHDSGDTTEQAAKVLGLQGFITTISTACSSSANSIMMAARMMRSGRCKRAIAGGTDALSAFTLNGFRSLMIYDNELCRPFDSTRTGLNLGEGAAYLLLETEESLKETGNKPLAILLGWANANDAYHQTASSPDGNGATMAMNGALQTAGISAQQISYVNAHGTGTPNNDLSESKALINVFGNSVPPFSSTKGFTGHTLAAAGGIEAVYSVLSLQHGALLPNLRYQNVIEECGLVPVTEYSEGNNIQYILSNSFGFGGNNSSLVFQKA